MVDGFQGVNIWKGNDRYVSDCALCVQRGGEGRVSNCGLNNVGYEGVCKRCPDEQVYVGESSRTAYTRIKEHVENYRAAATAMLPALQQHNNNEMCGKQRCAVQNK